MVVYPCSVTYITDALPMGGYRRGTHRQRRPLRTRTARGNSGSPFRRSLTGGRSDWVSMLATTGVRRRRPGLARWRAPGAKAGYKKHPLGIADDSEMRMGCGFCPGLKLKQKLAMVRRSGSSARGAEPAPNGAYTVGDACDDYLRWFEAHRKSLAKTRSVVDHHIRPKLGKTEAAKPHRDELRQWVAQLVAAPRATRGPTTAGRPVVTAEIGDLDGVRAIGSGTCCGRC